MLYLTGLLYQKIEDLVQVFLGGPSWKISDSTCWQDIQAMGEIAWRQEAKSLELRAMVSLGRVWQSEGKKEEARRMLVEIYGWFSEGFDTVDLQEAKALLEELS